MDHAPAGGHAASAPFAGEGELFKKVLGPRWRELHPDIQRRFDKNPAPGRPLRYTGILDELRASRFGWWLGYFTMPLVRGALLPYTQSGVPVDIQVYGLGGDTAIYKERTYRLHGRAPVVFTSHMREGEGGEVLEYVGAGLGMRLTLSVLEGNLHFRSDGYFWQLGRWRIPIPAPLTPGDTFLVHRNEGPAEFSIRIEIRHRWFGTSYVQAGRFRDLATPDVAPRPKVVTTALEPA